MFKNFTQHNEWSQARAFLQPLALFLALLLASCVKPEVAAEIVKLNGKTYSLFVPEGTIGNGCTLRNGEQSNEVILSSKTSARYALRLEAKPLRTKAGDRYRLAVWVKGRSNSRLDTPGPVACIRATLFDGDGHNAAGGNFYIGLKGVSYGDSKAQGISDIPKKWTKIDGIIEIPKGVAEMKLFIFCWDTSGDIMFREPQFEIVDNNFPLTP